MEFWGRQRELARFAGMIEEIRRTGQGRMVAVRGRRQSGKSRLLTRLVEHADAPYLYTTAVKNAAPSVQLQHVTADLAASRTPLPQAGAAFAASPSSWADLFARLPLAMGDGPAIVVLDEFPWSTETDSTLEGVLQNAWDQHLEQRPVLLVLVGSDLAMMAGLTEHDRPLYGRAIEMVISPLNPGEVAEALHGDRSAVDVLDAYLVTGGYPRLVTQSRRRGSTSEFVVDQLQDENSDLAVVAQRMLDAEFRSDLQARRVLEAIGATEIGHATFSSAAERLGGDKAAQTAVTRALEPLAKAKRVIAIDLPVGARPTTRLRRYRVADPYLGFWFAFVDSHLDDIARGRADLAVARFERGWSSWRGKAIEPVVHQAVSRLARSSPGLAGVDTVGAWWDRSGNHEFDVVGADSHGTVLVVGTVKWRPRKAVTSAELTALAQARGVIPHAAAARLLAVCPGGVRSGVDIDLLLDAEDLVAAFAA